MIIDTAKEHEASRARELCAGLQEGEIAIFDKGCIDLGHLHELQSRGVFWVSRAKAACHVLQERPVEGEKILRDCVIELKYHNSKAAYPEPLRLIRAKVEVEGQERNMEFLTPPSGVVGLQRGRLVSVPVITINKLKLTSARSDLSSALRCLAREKNLLFTARNL